MDKNINTLQVEIYWIVNMPNVINNYKGIYVNLQATY